MAYKGSFRRRRFTKRRFKRSSKGYVTQAQLRKVVRRNKPEVKFFADQVDYQTVAAGTLNHLTVLNQGVADGERVGLKSKLLSLQCNGSIGPGGATNEFCRMIIFQWFDDYNSPPTLLQVLEDTTGTGTPDYLSVYNWRYKAKYRIIYDKLYAVGATNAANPVKVFRKYLKVPSMIQWADDQGTNYVKGSLWMMTIGTGAAEPFVGFNWKLSYTDA